MEECKDLEMAPKPRQLVSAMHSPRNIILDEQNL